MSGTDALGEQSRLDALARYDILDTPREEAFDRITRLVRHVLRVPVATLTFLDAHRQWFKAREGLDACETDRGVAFCDITIRHGSPLIVPDTREDPRFASNPFVVNPPHLRFYAGIPLRSPEGQNVGTLCAVDTVPRQIDAAEIAILQDLARIVMDELELRLLVSTDSLTGAMSRRAFREEADRAMALAHRHGHELSCIALDLDRFKRINDTHGHAIGDSVLAGSVAVCRSLLRRTDLIGRLGGEEFAVLLPHTGVPAALSVAEKLREGIAAQVFEGADGPFGVTASLGVAAFEPAEADFAALLAAADTALYAAKASGRDRCVVASSRSGQGDAISRPVLKAGSIIFDGGRSVIGCTVRRLSQDGAKLAVVDGNAVPDRFRLAIAVDGFARPCQVAHKAATEIEVEFA